MSAFRSTLKLSSLLALAVLAACGVSAGGVVPCADDSSCPSDYPVCDVAAGKCIAGVLSPGSAATVQILAVSRDDGASSSAAITGTATVTVLARASTGVVKDSVKVTAGGKALALIASTPPTFTFKLDTALLFPAPGVDQTAVTLKAAMRTGDQPTVDVASADKIVQVDNRAPTLSAPQLFAADVKPGAAVEVDVTASETLSSITGTVAAPGVVDGVFTEVSVQNNVHRLSAPILANAVSGTYSITITAKDSAGNEGTLPLTPSFTVHTPATLSSSSLALSTPRNITLGSVLAATVGDVIHIAVALPAGLVLAPGGLPVISAAAAGSAGLGLQVTGSGSTFAASYPITAQADGDYLVTLAVTDIAGNVIAPLSWPFIVSKTPPSISGITLASPVAGPNLPIVFSFVKSQASAVASAKVNAKPANCSGSSVISCTYNPDSDDTVTGQVVAAAIVASVHDALGNTATASTTVPLDAQPPTLTLALVGRTNRIDGSLVQIDATPSEPLSALTATIDTGTGTLAEISAPTGSTRHFGYAVAATDTEGSRAVTFTATDLAANVTVQTLPAAFSIRHPFSLGLVTLSTGMTLNQTPGALATATVGTIVTVSITLPSRVTLGLDGTGKPTFNLQPSGTTPRDLQNVTVVSKATTNVYSSTYLVVAGDGDGIATMTVNATDVAGNFSTAASNVLIDKNVPIAAGLVASKNFVDGVSNQVTFTATANKRVQLASIKMSNSDAGTCTCDGGASCSAATSAAPLISCTVTVTHVTVASPTAVTVTLQLEDLFGNFSPATAAYQAQYTVVPAPAGTGLGLLAQVITNGLTTTLTPAFGAGTAVVTSTDGSKFVATNGTPITISPAGSTTTTIATSYTLAVSNQAGTTDTSQKATVSVVPAPVISGFSAFPTQVSQGDSTTLTASFSYGSATIDHGAGTPSNVGVVNIVPLGTTTYKLTVSNSATAPAQVSALVTVSVGALPSIQTFFGTATITTGSSTPLTATFTGGTGLIEPGDIAIASGTPVFVTPTSAGPTVYQLKVTNAQGGITQTGDGTPFPSITITAVDAPTFTSGTFSVSPAVITTGDSNTTVKFTVPTFGSSVITAQIKDGSGVTVVGSIANGGTANPPSPAVTTSYTLIASNAAGAQLQAGPVTVTVLPTPIISSFIVGTSGIATTGTITAGTTIQITPTFSGGTATIDNGLGVVLSGVPLTVSPAGPTTTYHLSVSNTGNPVQSVGPASVTISVVPAPAIAGFVAGQGIVSDAGSTTLNWNISNGACATAGKCKVAIAGGAVVANIIANGLGSVTVTPASDAMTTYVLTVLNSVGTNVTASVSVTAVALPAFLAGTFSVSVPTITTGDPGSFKFTAPTFATSVVSAAITDSAGLVIVTNILSGATSAIITKPTSTTTYTLTALNAAGASVTTTAIITVLPFPAIQSFVVIGGGTPTSASITAGTSIQLTATFSGGIGTIDNGVGTIYSGVPFTVSPGSGTVTYNLTVANSGNPVRSVAGSSVAITVVAAPAIAAFNSSQGTISNGTATSLNWSISNGACSTVGNCKITSGALVIPITVNGAATSSVTPAATATTVYLLTVTNSVGTNVTASTSVTTVALPAFTLGSFSVSSPTITTGDIDNFTFTAPSFSGTVSAAITDGNGTAVVANIVGGTTSAAIKKPTSTTTYTLTALNAAGASVTTTAIITVLPFPAIQSFVVIGGGTPTSASITAGTSIQLTATFSGGIGTIDNGVGTIYSGVPFTVSPGSGTVNYNLSVANSGNPVRSVTGSSVAITVVAAPAIAAFNSSQGTISNGTATSLNWSISNGACSTVGNCKITSGALVIPITVNGAATSSVTPAATATTVYLLTVTNSVGTNVTASISVTTVALPAFTLGSFSVSSPTITTGDIDNFTFTAPSFSGTVSAAITDGNGTAVVANIVGGTTSAAIKKPTSTTTYTLTALNAAGASVTTTAIITVLPFPAIQSFVVIGGGSPTSASITAGTSIQLTATFSGGIGTIDNGVGTIYSGVPFTVSPGSGTVNYNLSVANSGNPVRSVTGSSVAITVVAAPAIAAFNSSQGTISNGTATSLNWSISNGACSTVGNCKITSGALIVPISITVNGASTSSVTPPATATTIYLLTVTNSVGTNVTASTSVTTVALPAFILGSFSVSSPTITTGDVDNFTFTAPSFSGTVSAAITDGNGTTVVANIAGGATSAAIKKPTSTTTYTLTALNAAGASVTTTAIITVLPFPAIQSFVVIGGGAPTSASITAGTSIQLTATFSGGIGTIDNGVGTIYSGVPFTVSPGSGTVNYNLSVANSGNPVRSVTGSSVAITVVAAPAIAAFNSSQGTISNGTATSLNWSISNGACSTVGSCKITSGALTIPITVNGTSTSSVTPPSTATTVYLLTVTNSNGTSVTASSSITTVALPSFPTGSFTAAASSSPLVAGGSATITFTPPTFSSVTSAYITDGGGVVVVGSVSSGIVTGALPQPQTSTTYTLTALNAAGAPASSTTTVTVLNTFAPTGNMNVLRAYATSTELGNLKVLIAGGYDQAGTLATAEVYDLTTGTFTATVNNMSIGRGGHTATLLTSGKVLIVGGTLAGGTQARLELYDPVLNSFSLAPVAMNLTRPRFNHTATLLPNGKILIAGGEGAGFVGIRSAELVDLGASTTSEINQLALAFTRVQHTATLLNSGGQSGKVLLAGGNTSTTGTNEVYDPALNSFATNGNEMISPRSQHTATLLNSGKVLFVGGNRGAAALATAEVFDPGSLQFNPSTGAPLQARQRHSAVLLNNGNVLITGGMAGTAGSAEIYRFFTDNFSGTSPLLTARTAEHTATMLFNGLILVAGGTNGLSGSAELFNPE